MKSDAHQEARQPGTNNRRSLELEEQIRRRAYELYEKRGASGGHDLDDWLKAEAELKKKRRAATA